MARQKNISTLEKNVTYGSLLPSEAVSYPIPLDTKWLRETVAYYKQLGVSLERFLADISVVINKPGFQKDPDNIGMILEDAKRLFQI
ncbi:MAG: hypothetical protein ACI4UE_02275 [Candidatus Scatovivens sp.]